MTAGRKKILILATIVAQALAGAWSGQVVYLSHCDHERAGSAGCHEDGGCESSDCLAVLGHGHSLAPGHDHHCRCPHFHVRGEGLRVAQVRVSDSLRRFARAMPAVVPGTAAELRPEGLRSSPTSIEDQPGETSQGLRAVRSIRLLV